MGDVKQRPRVVYIGVFLTPESRTKLLSRIVPVHDVVYAHHATVLFAPKPEDLVDFARQENVKFQAVGYSSDDRGQAVLLRGLKTANANPHITISCTQDTKPNYSNELLQLHEAVLLEEPIDLVGTLDTFPLSTTNKRSE